MPKRRQPASRGRDEQRSEPAGKQTLRIVGGQLRSRRIQYSGNPRVRPMKDRTREAVFNLIGPIGSEVHVVDLFAGTGAMALEALSRGAARATLIEVHGPTAAVIRQNIESLQLADRVQLLAANVFFWMRQDPPLPAQPWLVFCCPPYEYYRSRWDDLRLLLEALLQRAPGGSTLVVEADTQFDAQWLPTPSLWRLRDYPPARIAVLSTEY